MGWRTESGPEATPIRASGQLTAKLLFVGIALSQRPKCYPVFWLIIERQLRIFKDKLIVDNSGQLLELLHKVHFGDQN